MRGLLAALVLALALFLPAAAQADSPAQPVSGSFQVSSVTPTSVRQVDATCFIELDATFAFDGSLTGSFTAHFRIVHHGPCDQPARETFQAAGTYQGAVGAATGTFDFVFQGDIDAQGHAEGQLVVQQGTGGLANLRGTLTLTGQAGVGGTYTGAVHFDP